MVNHLLRLLICMAFAAVLYTPVLAQKSGFIVFVSTGQLYRINADGGGLTRITTSGAKNPIVSRDRRLVAFITPRGIGFYNAGQNAKWVIPMKKPPSDLLSLTPDARRIYFSRDDAVFSALVNGNDEQPTESKPAWESWVSPFSPDGKWLVKEDDSDPEAANGLALISSDGKTQRSVPLGKTQQEYESLLDPVFSPDGKHIAFCWATSGDYVHGELFLVSPDGKSLTSIISIADDEPVVNSIEKPRFSPDGKQIAFIGWKMWGPDPYTETQSYLYIVGINGKGLRQLAKFGKTKDESLAYPDERDFCFSLDGKSLAFVKDGNIWTVNTNGRELRQLTKHYRNGYPCWVTDN